MKAGYETQADPKKPVKIIKTYKSFAEELGCSAEDEMSLVYGKTIEVQADDFREFKVFFSFKAKKVVITSQKQNAALF